ncbi:hypothetical protein [uncultured Polaribacter sp.]|uniref:hypothetical protein n=1 Tax=uncultured Polaribacter sp. TaxID=174711 RepID=UPI0030D7FC66|tara:strand:+ start:241 stop:960 length:720 start_codon:yes stop_codon:yes gene_type:complete
MKKIIKIFIFSILAISLSSCEDTKEEFNYVGFEAKTLTFGVDIGTTESKDLKVYVTKKSSSERTFSIAVQPTSTLDAGSYTLPTTVTIPANSLEGSFNVSIVDMNIGKGGETLILAISGDGIFTGEDMTLNVRQICPFNEVKLTLAFDTYPEEVVWWMTDADGNTVAASLLPLAYGAYAAGATGGIEELFCLPSGSYTFSIRDAYADGAGAFSLSLGGTALFTSNGAYAGGLDQVITLP